MLKQRQNCKQQNKRPTSWAHLHDPYEIFYSFYVYLCPCLTGQTYSYIPRHLHLCVSQQQVNILNSTPVFLNILITCFLATRQQKYTENSTKRYNMAPNYTQTRWSLTTRKLHTTHTSLLLHSITFETIIREFVQKQLQLNCLGERMIEHLTTL